MQKEFLVLNWKYYHRPQTTQENTKDANESETAVSDVQTSKPSFIFY